MRIVFDPATIDQGTSSSRSITGVVYFDFGEACFPAERWNDFVVVITSWWLEAIDKLERGIDREVPMYFMDGPYHLATTRMDGEQVRLRCIERRVSSEYLCHEELVTLGEFRVLVRRLLSLAVFHRLSTALRRDDTRLFSRTAPPALQA